MRSWIKWLPLPTLEHRRGSRPEVATFAFVNGGISIALLSLLSHFVHSPFVFPSLGPTAYLLFYRPMAKSASPKNVVLGHLLAAVLGWLCLAAFGLLGEGSAQESGFTWPRVGAAALSLAAISGAMVLLRVSHPPACSTTLMVSLGFMPHLWQIPVLFLAVVLMVAQGFFFNRLANIPYPLWSPNKNSC